MTNAGTGRVGLLWRGDGGDGGERTGARLQPVFEALAARSIGADAVVFREDAVENARRQLLRLDGVLVWVDPISGEYTRTALDALLRDISGEGVWVSAHPDVILKIGTKEILALTRDLSCGSDVHVYRTPEQFRSAFAARLAAGGARVIKRHRGNGGIGVWKVELDRASVGGTTEDVARVLVQDAQPRGTNVEALPLRDFMRRCEEYFAEGGCVIDQPFQSRIVDGMVRCYVVGGEVAGFALQEPDEESRASGNVFGLPSGKTMYGAGEPAYASLKEQMESEWISGIQRAAGVNDESLPLLWDADFLFGPKDAAGNDTYVLCEINVSSVLPFPETVPARLAGAVAARLRGDGDGRGER